MIAPFWDGNWLDISSGLGGLAWACARWCKRLNVHRKQNSRWPPIFTSFFCKTTAVDLAAGTSLVPLGILSLALFSSPLLHDLLVGNRLILTIAGITSLFGALEDF